MWFSGITTVHQCCVHGLPRCVRLTASSSKDQREIMDQRHQQP